MGQYAGELRFGVEIRQEAAVDVNQSARQREGIDVR
jgi:hypothetical protein